MLKTETKTWHRLVAFVLSFVMVLGMLPVRAARAEEITQPVEEETPETEIVVLQGTVGVLTPGGTVDDSTALFANMTLTEVPADESIGRNVTGWWVGAKVTAPADLDISNAMYGRKGSEKSSFKEKVITENGETFLPLWVLVNEEYVVKYETINYTWTFDWDGDNVDDQTVKISIDSKSMTLVKEDGTEVFPAPYGKGKVTTLTEGAAVVGSDVAFTGTLYWEDVDMTVGREWEGWWVGVRVHAPATMDEEQLKSALYGNPKNEERTVFASEMSLVDGEYVVDFWFLVNDQYLKDYNPLSYTRVFDWNGDGYAEQTVKTTIDPANVILMKGEEQVYPELPKITIQVSATDNAVVMINGEAVSGTVELVENEPVNVEVAPKELADGRAVPASIVIAGQTCEADANGKYTGEFTFAQDDTIEVAYNTVYDVTFANGAGTFTDLDGNTVNSVAVPENGSVSFKFNFDLEGYQITVKDGENVLTADADGVYTVSAINESHSITAEVVDKTDPVISKVTVSNPSDWTTSKIISVEASDNSGTVNVYISATELLAFGETAAASMEVKANGLYHIYAVDEAGNKVHTTVQVENIDTTGPDFSNYKVKENKGSFLIWEWTESFTYSFNVEDPESGIKRVWYSTDKDDMKGTEIKPDDNNLYSFTVEENGTYYIFAQNNAGMVVRYDKESVVGVIDKRPPVIGEANVPGGWQVDEVTVTFSAQDDQDGAVSGIANAYYSTNSEYVEGDPGLNLITDPDSGNSAANAVKNYSFTVYENGIYYIHVVDRNNNVATRTVEISNVDNAIPTISAEATIQDGDEAYTGDWTNQNVTISIKVSDSQSGISKVYYSTSEDNSEKEVKKNKQTYSITVKTKDFDGTYYVWCVDNVGKKSEVTPIQVKIDTTKPEVTDTYFTTQRDQEYKMYGYTVLVYPSSLTVYVKAEDQHSGVVKYEYGLFPISGDPTWHEATDVTVTDGVAAFTVTKNEFIGRIIVRVTDAAGNTSVYGDSHKNTIADHPDYRNKWYDGYEACWVELNDEKASKPMVNVTLETTNDTGEVVAYEGGWVNKPVVIHLDSTLKDGIAYYEYSVDGGATWTRLEVNSTDAEHNKYDLTVDQDTNAEYTFRAVSNKLDAEGNNIVGSEEKCTVKVQITPPANAVVTVSEPDGTNGWHISRPSITIDENKAAENEIPRHTEYKLWNTENEEPEEWTMLGSNNAPVIPVHEDGELKGQVIDGVYKLMVKTVDETNLESDIFIQEIKVDATAPTDLKIIATYEQAVLDENGEPVLDKDGKEKMEIVENDIVNNTTNGAIIFDTFYNHSITIKLAADLAISNNGSLKYVLVQDAVAYAEGGYDSDDSLWLEYPKDGIQINPDEKFVLYFRAVDEAGNKTTINTTGIVVDNKAPAGGDPDPSTLEAPQIAVNIPMDDAPNGIHIGREGFEIQVIVFDPNFLGTLINGNSSYSGLNKIVYKLYTPETDSNQSEEGVLFERTEADAENGVLTSNWNGTIFVDPNKFNSNNVYLEIFAVDNAGNSVPRLVGPIMIDITDPDVTVDYNDSVDPENQYYYKAGREMVITVTDRNFEPELLKYTLTRDHANVEITNSWIKTEGTGNGDDTTWTLVIPCNVDGNYSLQISELTDLAGNAKLPGENKTYIIEDAFVVDTAAPKINVNFFPNDATNGKYFNKNRTADITIEDRNFDRDRTTVIITLDGRNINIPGSSFVRTNGDFWTVTARFETDGDYTFDVTATDRAGNQDGGVNYGNSVAPEVFTIDTTIELPTVGGVENGGAYPDEVAPSVDIYDINFDDYTLTLTRTNENVKDEDVTDLFFDLIEFNAPGGTLRTEDLPHIPENDGIYTLTVVITDMAGNEIPSVTTFTVNRFGSVYDLGDYLREDVKDQYLQEITGDLVVIERNPDKLEDGSVQVEITCDGKPVENVVFETSTKTANNEFGWYEYTYTLSKDYFTGDGVYKITFMSKDKTGNESQSDVISFRVDKTAPELTSVVGLEERIINAQEQEVRYTVFDTMGLAAVEIWVKGQLVQTVTDFEDINNYTGSFVLTEENDAQHVRIVIRDIAGNVTDTDSEDFTSAYKFNKNVTVSTNWLVRWFANKPLFFGSLAGGAGGLWLLWFLIFGKRKKDEEEETK